MGAAVIFGTQLGAHALHPPCAAGATCALDLPRREMLEGWVASEPTALGLRHRFDLEAAAIGRQGRPLRGRIRIWARGLGDGWHAGDCIRAHIWLRRPRNFRNPGAFDYVGHLRRQGISVVGSIWQAGTIERCRRRRHGVSAAVVSLRQRVGKTIDSAVAPPTAGVLRALVIGDRANIPKVVRKTFGRAGVAHVLAISGLHLAILTGVVFTAARFLMSRSETLLARGLAPRLAALGALPITLAYALLAGSRPPTLRATVMVGVYLIGVAVGRRSDVFRGMAVAALVMGVGWPGVVFEPAFHLSFAAVLSIAVGSRHLRAGWNGLALAGLAQHHGETPEVVVTGICGLRARLTRSIFASGVTALTAAVGTAPLSAFYFNTVSLVGPVANLVVVPLFSLAIVTALAGAAVAPAVPTLAIIPFRLAGLFVEFGHRVALVAARLPRGALRVATPTAMEMMLVYGLLGCLVGWRYRYARVLFAGLMLLAVGDAAYWIRARYARPDLRITFLDVGQGDAAVVEFPGSAVLVVDAGGFSGSDFDSGEAVVAPFLWSRKITRIDYLAMSHADTDHAGGLGFLVEEFRPREFWWSGRPGQGAAFQRLAASLDRQGVRQRILARDTRSFAVGPVEVRTLHPPPVLLPGVSENDSSVVLRLRWGATTVLFSGDIEGAAEASVLTNAPHTLVSAVLKVPHHGSRTSNSPRFLDAVRPSVGVVSVGAGNRHGFPHLEVRKRYEARRICLRRTDEDGAIIVRGSAGRYWIHPPCGTG